MLWPRLDTLRKQTGGDIDVAIDPEELEGLDDAAIKQLYEQRLAEEQARRAREVCSTCSLRMLNSPFQEISLA